MDHHTIVSWIRFLIIGGLIGWMTGHIARERGFGIIGDIIIGIIGSLLGVWIAGVFKLYTGSPLGVVIMAFIGAAVLVGLTRLIKRTI